MKQKPQEMLGFHQLFVAAGGVIYSTVAEQTRKRCHLQKLKLRQQKKMLWSLPRRRVFTKKCRNAPLLTQKIMKMKMQMIATSCNVESTRHPVYFQFLTQTLRHTSSTLCPGRYDRNVDMAYRGISLVYRCLVDKCRIPHCIVGVEGKALFCERTYFDPRPSPCTHTLLLVQRHMHG